MLDIFGINKLADLLKARSSQRTLISKTDLGNRTLYLYRQPDGTMKEVYHKKSLNPRKDTAKAPIQAPGMKGESADDEPPKPRRKRKPEPEKEQKYATYQEQGPGRRHKYFVPSSEEYELVDEQDSRSGISLKWKILKHKKKGTELHLMEGDKFHLSLYDFQSTPSKDKIAFAVNVQNIKIDNAVYRKGVHLPVKDFTRDPLKFLLQVSFLKDEQIQQKTAHWVSTNSNTDLKSVVHGIEYGLESTYFLES